MKTTNTCQLIVFCIVPVLVVACGNRQPEKLKRDRVQMTDMAGRTVNVPKNVTSVFGADMTVTFLMQALAPEMLAARNIKPTSSGAMYFAEELKNLPELGVIFYGRSTVNVEDLAKLKPDILLCPLFQHTTPAYIADYENYEKKTGAVVVMVALDLERLPEAFRFMGKLLGKEDEAEVLAAYCRQTLDWAGSVRSNIRDVCSIYAAEGTSGLQTIPATSTHSQVFSIAGVRNCAVVDEDFGYRDIAISMEQIMRWNPDYIIVNSRASSETHSALLSKIRSDKAWQSLGAVKANRILVVPTIPFNWIGRPPGINRLIGIRWLASTLYPEIASVDMTLEIKRFYSLFYHVTPTSEQIKTILNEKY